MCTQRRTAQRSSAPCPGCSAAPMSCKQLYKERCPWVLRGAIGALITQGCLEQQLGTNYGSVPLALPALTTFFTGCCRTLFIFGLPVSPEGLRQSPSAITDCTSILKCQVAGKFTASQGPSGGGGSAAPSPSGCAGERAASACMGKPSLCEPPREQKVLSG